VSPGVATALAQMGQCATVRRAAGWEVIARSRGATDEQIAAAWDEWRRLQDEQVRVWGGGER
jgi:hypothetical protein